MSTYGTFTITLPTVGQFQWDVSVNDILQAVADVLNTRVPVSSLDVSSQLDMQGNLLVDCLGIEFVPNGDPGVANSVFYLNGDLWLRDGSNRSVQVSSGGAIAASPGSIGGDYSAANPNGATYNSSTGFFVWTSSPTGPVYAGMENGAVRIHNGNSSGYVGLSAPSGIGSTVVGWTFPTALPAGKSPVIVDATGTITHYTNTTLDGRGLIHTGSSVFIGPASFTGSLAISQTGSMGVVRAARDILHDAGFTMQIPASMAQVTSPAFFDTAAAGFRIAVSTASGTAAPMVYPIPLKQGDQILSWKLFISKNTAPNITCQLFRMDGTQGFTVPYGNVQSTNVTSGRTQLTGSDIANAGVIVAGNNQYYLLVGGGGTSGDFLFHAEVTWNRATGSV